MSHPVETSGNSPKAHYGSVTDERMTADEMDERRHENMAYEYLCHLEEAKVWIEACINEPLVATTELEEGLRNGVYLAKLAHFMCPEHVTLKKIYDKDQTRYQARGLHFRHTDNINHFLLALDAIGMPKIFSPETTDIYDRKNIPRLIYCIHALSLFLFKLGKAPQIQDLYGKIKFTDEEISAMRRELEKYGIQMPAFSKIGGILANEMPVDEAALHAAVIAINEAIDKQVPEETLSALQNPMAHLVNISPDMQEDYQDMLYAAKSNKAEIARNKSMDPDGSYIPDVYDELLTQAEIQGNINKTHTYYAVSRVHQALEKGDRKALLEALRMAYLSLREVKDENVEGYYTKLQNSLNEKKNNNVDEGDCALSRDELQFFINEANTEASREFQKKKAIENINAALDGSSPADVMAALRHPSAELPEVHEYASGLYHEELRNMKREKQADLDWEELGEGLKVLTAIAEINQAVETGNTAHTWVKLNADSACLQNLDEDNADKYLQALDEARAQKQGNGDQTNSLLTHYEIQECINTVNKHVGDENARALAVGQINDSIDEGDHEITLQALQVPEAKIMSVDPVQSVHYQNLLHMRKQQKAQVEGDPTTMLWWEEIQETVNVGNAHAVEGGHMSVGVAAINQALEAGDIENLRTYLCNPDVQLHSVTPDCTETYYKKLAKMKNKKAESGDTGSGWMMNKLRDGHKYFFNVKTAQFSWERAEGVKKDNTLLTREEIQGCVAEVTAAHNRELLYHANEPLIVKLQARARGNLVRRRQNSRLNYLRDNTPAIVKLQSWWRMARTRKRYVDYTNYTKSNEKYAITLQAATRMFLARKRYQDRMAYLRAHEKEARTIQRYVKSKWAKQDFQNLMYGENPPVGVVRRFVHLLDMGDVDYDEEIEMQKLKQQVVQDIRTNNQLEQDLNQMDIKIGLLVKNRITLQDVVSHQKTMKKYREDSSSNLHGIKALSKHSRERRKAYEHLFYLLQTNPVYLAKLIFEMPQNQTNRFMESVILTLLNYASNQREEYLLLKLFETALHEEIRVKPSDEPSVKTERMSDIVTGSPMVVKMIVSFNRNTRGQGSLRDLLNPLVHGVIDDPNLMINTNPVEVYKSWVNQVETETGKALGLPYEATPEEALQHKEVRERIDLSVTQLRNATEKFLTRILQCIDHIPYGMRYMAKVMRDALRKKFPSAPDKDILKIVGNLIYYRYINSAIVAPDAFDIIDVPTNKGLTNDQRRNLGSIAKILQFAASNKGFGGDSAHLSCLNSYLMDAHTRFKKYFQTICEVDDPEVVFNMDQYTDVTRVTKPVIYISVQEIIDTHKQLIDHQDALAPDTTDVLHELLDDLDGVPTLDDLLGDAGIDDNGTQSKAALAKTEISLTLANKHEVPEDEKADVKSLLIRTKRMCVDVIRCQQSGDNLTQILNIPATEAEEAEHQALIAARKKVDKRSQAVSQKAKLERQHAQGGETTLPLEEMKVKIRENLDVLEKERVVTRSNNYQALINSIAQDIRNQRIYRQRRKQEMLRLRTTLKSLAAKRSFFEEQVDYYNQYVKTCLDNLATKTAKKRKSSSGKEEKKKTKKSVKYSAAKLHEKGVVLEIEGLTTDHFKNVLFEIASTDDVGKFDVNAKFMGVGMDKVELVFQDLLQLQYEGVAVMQMFDRARVNVNLLIFLINKKFYGK